MNEVLSHPWFQSLNKNQILKKQHSIPEKELPKLSSDVMDLHYFDEEIMRMSIRNTMLSDEQL